MRVGRAAIVGLLFAMANIGVAAADAFDQSHALYGQVLARFVVDGRVDYARLKLERTSLDGYRAQLAAVTESTVASWSRAQQLAFWINAYNAGVLATVADGFPVSRGTLVGLAFPANSIWQIPGAFKEARHRVAGRLWSLDNIEHDILRPKYREPRVHMALVCAARGCPPLRSEPFVSSRLDAQLEDQTMRYLADREHGLRWLPEARRVEVSRIFKWFAEDFSAGGGVREFIAAHVSDPAAAAIVRDSTSRISYLDYDWELNGR